MGLLQRFLDWLRALFWKEEMELTLVGLQYSGKTTFVNVLGKKNVEGSMFIAFSFWKLFGGFDSDRRLQHAQGSKGKRLDKDLGYWRAAAIQGNVGEILPRG